MVPLQLKKFIFKIYLSLPGSQYFFLLVKKFGIPSYRWRRLMRFHGAFDLAIEDGVSIKVINYGNTIENELFWLGTRGWENLATKAWTILSKHSSVIMDVGANTGLYSLISAKVNPSCEVHAFEPLNEVVARLRQNIEINGLKVHVHPIALAEVDGEGTIFIAETVSSTFDQASLNKDNYIGKASKAIIIQKSKLSTFIDKQGFRGIDLMKIDVETFEGRVLQGMDGYLKQFAPSILIEILNNKVAEDVQALIADIEYQYYLIDEKKGYIKTDSLRPLKKGNNFLLVNKARHGELLVTKHLSSNHDCVVA